MDIREIDSLFEATHRYRDLAISPDGRTIYAATDAGGFTRSADGGAIDQMANPGGYPGVHLQR